MKIQHRNIIFLFIFAVSLLVFGWLVARQVLLGEFTRLENQQHSLHIRQLHEILAIEKSNLLAQVQDWAAWDETYKFVLEPTAEYLRSSFAAGGLALEGLDLDLLVIVDRNGKTVYGEVFYEQGELHKLPVGAVFHPSFQEPVFLEMVDSTEGATGYVMKHDRPLLLAAYPVLTSQNRGPSRGAVVMGRFLDAAQLEDFSTRFQHPLTWDIKGVAKTQTDHELIYRMALDTFGNESAGTIGFREQREITRQGERTAFALIGYFAVALTVMILLLFFFQERYLFGRIRRLQKAVAKAPRVLNERYRIPAEPYRDEVGSLVAHINQMFEGLYQKRQQEIELHYQERLADMGKMVAMIAHQWRQPLQVVGALLQNLQIDYENGLLTKAYLQKRIDEGMAVLLQMSATITEFGRIYRPTTEKSRFRPKAQLKRAIDLAAARSDGKCTLSLSGEDIEIEGYPAEFLQVVMALVQNSQEAIDESGKTHGKIKIDLTQEAEFARVTIEDNGGGIPEAQMQNIFEPYYSTKKVLQGFGKGLFMVKMAVERGMGGKVRVQNSGEGVRATICLPMD